MCEKLKQEQKMIKYLTSIDIDIQRLKQEQKMIKYLTSIDIDIQRFVYTFEHSKKKFIRMLIDAELYLHTDTIYIEIDYILYTIDFTKVFADKKMNKLLKNILEVDKKYLTVRYDGNDNTVTMYKDANNLKELNKIYKHINKII